MKNLARKLISFKIRQDIRANIKYLRSSINKSKKEENVHKLSLAISKISFIKMKNKHAFCGYYDIAPNSKNDNSLLLIYLLNKRAIAGKDEIELALYDLRKQEIVNTFYHTKAWCWQQGSRLRWGKDPYIVFFNDIENEKYCSRKYSLKLNKIIETFPYALYDISEDETFGLTVNFARLQRLRPGYGYGCFQDQTDKEQAPDDDGLFKLDLITGKVKLLVSLKELASRYSEKDAGEHYINHVCISPDGGRAMFFHIWTKGLRAGWKTNLCVIDLHTEETIYIETEDQVSHYCWKDNETLLITGKEQKSNREFYKCYDLKRLDKVTLQNNNLRADGHPVYSRKVSGFYSDTYPNDKCMQSFFFYNEVSNQYIKLMELYSNPKQYGEKRCDLHPHYFENMEMVALDSTCYGNKRSIVLLTIDDEKLK